MSLGLDQTAHGKKTKAVVLVRHIADIGAKADDRV
jgi:hypothetical protein